MPEESIYKNNSSGIASIFSAHAGGSNNVQSIQPTRVASRVGSAKAPTSSANRTHTTTTSSSARQPVKSNRIGSTYDKTFHNKVDKLVSDPIRQVTGRKNILAKEGVMPTKPTDIENNAVRGTVAKKLGVQPSRNNNQAKLTRPVNGAFGKDQWEIEWDDKDEKSENIIPKQSKPSNNLSGDINSINWIERLGRGKCSSICDVNGRPVTSIESSSSHWYILTYEEKSFLDIETEDFNITTSIKIQKGNENSLFTIVLDYGINKRCKDEYIAIVMNVAQKYWKIERVENKKVVPVQQAIDKSLAPLKYMDISISLSERKLTLKNDNTEIFTDVILPISSEGSKERRVGLGVMSAKVSIYDWTVFDPKTQEKEEDLPIAERPLPDYIDKHLAEMIKRDIIEFNPNVTWESIAELHDAKRLLKEAVVLPLLMPDIFAGLRSPWKGVLLFGPPGTGKTMVARAVATEGKTTFFNCSASTLVSKYHGESERLVKTLFQMARLFSPSTIFFDEIDALMMTRGSSSEHEASRRLKSEILTQIDGINSQSSRVMVLATTNKPWDLDEAMRRRLEKRIYIPLPYEKTRVSLFNIFLKDQEMESDVSTESLAVLTDGYSGADIHLLCREAALRPLRKELDHRSTEEIMKLKERGELKLSLCMEDFSESVKTMKPSVSQNEIEKYQQWMKEFQSV
ncbi:katanin p60 subunit [Naegleria gruberi]|uniref:Katanin p60 ATPase-containing subunit A1 n=1 Tax=Naegleria gruberi TaxID=5762 RepID=D2V4Q4_NAEGR|nr:katanin p60 subunit [Naegleria gruberi]EFC47973.1 katanin p60 subunit [Naegleria gruberi]|eukprot:XP_002680717.1 katanin p60 subunit [Naegleria gruberi strain NEG-M]